MKNDRNAPPELINIVHVYNLFVMNREAIIRPRRSPPPLWFCVVIAIIIYDGRRRTTQSANQPGRDRRRSDLDSHERVNSI